MGIGRSRYAGVQPVSGEARKVASEAARQARQELQYFGASEDFTRSPVDAAVEAAYAIDLPRREAEVRAEERAATLREVIAWLNDVDGPQWCMENSVAAYRLAAHFNPEAER